MFFESKIERRDAKVSPGGQQANPPRGAAATDPLDRYIPLFGRHAYSIRGAVGMIDIPISYGQLLNVCTFCERLSSVVNSAHPDKHCRLRDPPATVARIIAPALLQQKCYPSG
jgi:hypothetical protein